MKTKPITSWFAHHLSKLIHERGVTRYRVAEDTGIARSHMGRLASGEQEPSWSMVERLADYFGVTTDSFRAKK